MSEPARIWKITRSIILAMTAETNESNRAHYSAEMPQNPWPGSSRRGVHSRAMTVGEAGVLLRACLLEMTRTMEMAARLGQHYEGPTVAELLPFIVTLTFWTFFNPDTVVGLKVSDI